VTIARGRGLRVLVASFMLVALAAAGACHAFDFEDVAKRAKDIAASPYKKPDVNLPKALQELTYDQYRDIRYKPDRALWRTAKLPFEVMFFHQGLYYNYPVAIHEITANGGVRDVPFDPDLFDYGHNKLDPNTLRGLGFAGFRVHYPVNSQKYKDEVLVFLGASYFRALGKGQRYGISARALAIDTALTSGEEFPRFTEFWIERPQPNAHDLRIYALLDSPSASGAYRFVLRPGVDTIVDVHSRLFLRHNVAKLGLAPLTSMYYFGENHRIGIDDFRPEVHDSDGLSIHSGTGEWLWRPLVNPKRLLVTSFAVDNPQGFGVQQRDRHFYRYEDLEARYETRPSVWIEPRGAWGGGRIELVQIPTPDETNDNVVAYFVPDVSPAPQQGYDLDYRMLWQMDNETLPTLAHVSQSRRGHGYRRKPDDSIAFMIDFEGEVLKKLPIDTPVEGVVSGDANIEIVEVNAYRNDVTNGWRLALRFKRHDDKKASELRAFLRTGTTTLSETWSYILPAQ
jgi:glucans biosynthesis protein